MEHKATLIGIAPQLIVQDVVRTAEYYRDVLGFNIIGYFLDPPVYSMVERDNFQLHFAKSSHGEANKNEHYNKVSTDLIIWVPAIDIFFEEVKSKGAEITEGIVQRVYGSREFVIRDCNGYKITVAD